MLRGGLSGGCAGLPGGYGSARTNDPIAAISTRVGYTSEAAFSRAFKRYHGMTPGAVRRAAAAMPSLVPVRALP